MKKSKSKPDLLSMMAMMQEQLSLLDKKMDVVIEKTVLKPVQGVGRAVDPNAARQNAPRKERQLYEAICADCGKVCEVPFRPSGERPVYCKECFAKRKSGHFSNIVTPPSSAAAPTLAQATVSKTPKSQSRKAPKRAKKSR